MPEPRTYKSDRERRNVENESSANRGRAMSLHTQGSVKYHRQVEAAAAAAAAACQPSSRSVAGKRTN